MKAKLIKEAGGYDLYRIDEDGKRVTFASTQDYKQKLSLKNCQAIECGYDLDELARDMTDKEHPLATQYSKGYKKGIVIGFQNALDLNNTKLYTLEDMINCWNKALTFQDNKETLGEYIQSLQQTEWDVEIEMEEVAIGDKYTPEPKPKLDADGCLILKLKSE